MTAPAPGAGAAADQEPAAGPPRLPGPRAPRPLERVDPALTDRGLQVPPHSDLRLLGPAVLAWVVAAATLGVTARGHLAVAGAAAVVAVVLSLCRCPLRARPLRWPLVLTLTLVLLLQVAAAAHSTLRARGGVEALAEDRAAVTAVVVVTGDPFVLAGRGDDTRVLRDGTVEVLDARGVRRAVGAPVLLTGDASLAAPGWRSTVRVQGRLGPAERADDRVATLAVARPPEVLTPARGRGVRCRAVAGRAAGVGRLRARGRPRAAPGSRHR